VLVGVSTRTYATVLEPAGPEVEEASSSTSKSAVSRRFVEATRARLGEFRSRSLADRRWLVVYIDGFALADEGLIGALGVDEKGNKTPPSSTAPPRTRRPASGSWTTSKSAALIPLAA